MMTDKALKKNHKRFQKSTLICRQGGLPVNFGLSLYSRPGSVMTNRRINHKSQESKLQANPNCQKTNHKRPHMHGAGESGLFLVWDLAIVVWCLFGIWILQFGIHSILFPACPSGVESRAMDHALRAWIKTGTLHPDAWSWVAAFYRVSQLNF